MTDDLGQSGGWAIHGRFVIDGADQDEAERALKALERTAKRVGAAVTIHVQISEGEPASVAPSRGRSV